MIPPLALSAYRRLRYGPPGPPEWEVLPGGWDSVPLGDGSGWAHRSIAEAQRRKWPAYRDLIRRPNPLSVAHEDPRPDGRNVAGHNALVSFAYALALAARGVDRLSLLDFGCGAGHYAPLAAEILPGLAVEYFGHDLPHLCALGRELNPGGTFLDRQELCWERPYDFVLVSGSLQYERDWRRTLSRLAAVAGRWLFVTRLPVATKSGPFVVLQRVGAYGYDTEYAGWVFDRSEFLTAVAGGGMALEREFLMLDAPCVAGTAAEVRYRGFLFRRAG